MNKEQERQLQRMIQVADEAHEALNIERFTFNLPADLVDSIRRLPDEVMPWHELDDERLARILYAYLSSLPDEVKKEAGVRNHDDPTAKLKLATRVIHDKLNDEGIDLSKPLAKRKKPRGPMHVH